MGFAAAGGRCASTGLRTDLLTTRAGAGGGRRTAGFAAVGGAVVDCGSGIAATDTALAMALLGNWNVAVYDGSWTEWGGRTDLPIATG